MMNNYVENILKCGRVSLKTDKEITDKEVELVLKLLENGCRNKPKHFLNYLAIGASTEMLSLGVAMFLAYAPKEFLSHPNNTGIIFDIITPLNVCDLLEIVEYLRSKCFGRGFGSRAQKIVRGVMEAWTVENLEEISTENKKELINLLKLVHPRYKGERGDLVKGLLVK